MHLVPFATGAPKTPSRGRFYSNMVTRKPGFGRDPKLLGGIWAIIPPCLFLNFNFTLMISEVPFPHLISK